MRAIATRSLTQGLARPTSLCRLASTQQMPKSSLGSQSRRGFATVVNEKNETVTVPPSKEPEKQLTLREMASKYGILIIVTYTGVWITTGVSCYLAVTAFGPEAAINGLKMIGVDRFVDLSQLNPQVGNVAVAALVNELLEPIRLPIYLFSIRPLLRRYEARLQAQPSLAAADEKRKRWEALGKAGLVYYWAVWMSTYALTFGGISAFGPDVAFDALRYLHLDQYVDVSGMDQKYANAALALVVNELLEPVRLPFVFLTFAPVRRAFKL